MAFNPILDALPAEFGGVPVDTDFKNGLRFFRALADKELDSRTRGAVIVRLFFKGPLPPTDDIWPFIEWYLAGGEERKAAPRGARVFDWNVDAGRLYAAFLQTYRIDLRTAQMHWWVFLELFRALPEDTMLMKVLDIRGKKPPKGADEEYKSALRNAKRAFAIEDTGAPQKAADAFRQWAGREV